MIIGDCGNAWTGNQNEPIDDPSRYFSYRHFIPYKCIGDARENLQWHFHPLHWADLQNSDLREKTIWEAGIYSVCPDQISSILGFNPTAVTSALAFPYPGINFIRLKVFPPFIGKEGHRVKYLQPPRSGVHAYFPPNFWPRYSDPAMKILITEGEKKALSADQNGFCCVGIGGIWMWKKKGTPDIISDLQRLDFRGRVVEIIPDSDVMTNINVLNGTIGLCDALKNKGANVDVKLTGVTRL